MTAFVLPVLIIWDAIPVLIMYFKIPLKWIAQLSLGRTK
jgi:hypothetical protein